MTKKKGEGERTYTADNVLEGQQSSNNLLELSSLLQHTFPKVSFIRSERRDKRMHMGLAGASKRSHWHSNSFESYPRNHLELAS